MPQSPDMESLRVGDANVSGPEGRVRAQLRVFVDMDGVLCDIAAAYMDAARTHPDVAFPQSIPGLFASLRPMSGAVEAVTQLRSDPRFDVWILSAPSTRNPACYSEKRVWVEKMFDYPLAKRLILCSDKSLLRGDVLIDDNVSGKGQDRFEGELVHFGSARFPTWDSVLEYLHLRSESGASGAARPDSGAAAIGTLLSRASGAGPRGLHTEGARATRTLSKWKDLQEAHPESLTGEAYAAMLRGETVNPWGSETTGAKHLGAAWRVHSVAALPDYCLRVIFIDGVTGVVRMSRLIQSDRAGVFAGLRDHARFADVRVELGAVSWPGGIDLAPDAMHDAIASSGEWVP
jgi:hypothetical protein